MYFLSHPLSLSSASANSFFSPSDLVNASSDIDCNNNCVLGSSYICMTKKLIKFHFTHWCTKFGLVNRARERYQPCTISWCINCKKTSKRENQHNFSWCISPLRLPAVYLFLVGTSSFKKTLVHPQHQQIQVRYI